MGPAAEIDDPGETSGGGCCKEIVGAIIGDRCLIDNGVAERRMALEREVLHTSLLFRSHQFLHFQVGVPIEVLDKLRGPLAVPLSRSRSRSQLLDPPSPVALRSPLDAGVGREEDEGESDEVAGLLQVSW